MKKAVERIMDLSLASRLPVRSVARYSVLLVAFSLLSACNKPKTDAKEEGAPVESSESLEPVQLTITGYNYTDLYIDSFEVHGVGGGNVRVSSPTSGGGGGTCCLNWVTGGTLPMELDITWTRDMNRWCKGKAVLKGPEPSNPEHIGIHFFPDGRIEAEITEEHAEPKLRLERFNPMQRKASDNTVADEKVARCENGYIF